MTSLSTTGLQGRPVSDAAPAAGKVLAWDGSEWAPAPDADTTYDGTDFAVSSQSCPAAQVMVGTGPDGLVQCRVQPGPVSGFETVESACFAEAGENCTAIASCPNGKTAVGGGYFNTCIDAKALGNHPSWNGNWSATFVVPASTICTPPVKLQVFATCVDSE